MNHVFLSGTTEKGAVLISREEEIPHAVMLLTVTHRTTRGEEKREQYPLSAWRGTAVQLANRTEPGCRLAIKGYLSQRNTPEGILLEVTVEEFQVSGGKAPTRPPRRYWEWNTNMTKEALAVKQTEREAVKKPENKEDPTVPDEDVQGEPVF